MAKHPVCMVFSYRLWWRTEGFGRACWTQSYAQSRAVCSLLEWRCVYLWCWFLWATWTWFHEWWGQSKKSSGADGQWSDSDCLWQVSALKSFLVSVKTQKWILSLLSWRMWLDLTTIILRNLNCMHTYGESLQRVRSEQGGCGKERFRKAEQFRDIRLLLG